MANRSDRSGEAPKEMLATRAVLVDWLPAHVFHPGQEHMTPQTGRRYDCSQTYRTRSALELNLGGMPM